MPIRRELRHYYDKHWRFITRPRILERAGHKCEACGKPDHTQVLTMTWEEERRRRMIWSLDKVVQEWRNEKGEVVERPKERRRIRHVDVILTVAHLNHMAGEDNDDNLRAWCQWCHLHYDSTHHKETRQTGKDAKRPLFTERRHEAEG